MGYQDREYMRGEGSGGEGRSNPLWWILGLIALILVVAYFRRGAMSDGAQPQSLQQLIETGGQMQTCQIELDAGGPHAERVLPWLRTYFLQQGYNSAISETAAATQSSAMFTLSSSNTRFAEYAIYQHIRSGHETLKPRHMLRFQVYRPGAAAEQPPWEHAQEVSQQLLLRLEAEFPGLVRAVNDTPRPVAYDDYD